MARLTEEMVIARSKQSDLSAIKKLNCWGAELGDVTLLRRMPNVEVLALSINKIRTLDDFSGCRRLRELYVRKNEIRSLAEIRHLRRLPALTALWLDENPCTQHPEYRLTVLRNLPNLEKLDNVPVQPEELAEAARRGHHIPDSDDEGYVQQECPYVRVRSRSCESSPERDYPPAARQGSEGSEPGLEPALDATPPDASQPQTCVSPARRPPAASPDSDERYEHPAMTRSVYDEYSYSSNGDCRYNGGGGGAAGGGGGGSGGVTSPHYHEPYYDKPERSESYQQVPQWEGEEGARRGGAAAGGAGGYPSAVMGERRGFTRRPVARNSNLLSAVLCLVKELDYPSLEVAEMAVRCRMDELANSQ